MSTLHESWEKYQAEVLPKATPAETADAQQKFYGGALAIAVLLKNYADPVDLWRELMAYGRQVGR